MNSELIRCQLAYGRLEYLFLLRLINKVGNIICSEYKFGSSLAEIIFGRIWALSCWIPRKEITSKILLLPLGLHNCEKCCFYSNKNSQNFEEYLKNPKIYASVKAVSFKPYYAVNLISQEKQKYQYVYIYRYTYCNLTHT